MPIIRVKEEPAAVNEKTTASEVTGGIGVTG